MLTDNAYEPTAVEELPGFHLAFQTVSETGEQVGHALNMLFVPKQEIQAEATLLVGDYLRDRAYEESRPIVSQFRFDSDTRELMTTT